jgi:hypothetical protein
VIVMVIAVPVVTVEGPVDVTADAGGFTLGFAPSVARLALGLANSFSGRRAGFPHGITNLPPDFRTGFCRPVVVVPILATRGRQWGRRRARQ